MSKAGLLGFTAAMVLFTTVAADAAPLAGLDVDCAAHRSDPRCDPREPNIAVVGGGPSFHWMALRIGAGFIEGAKLVLPMELAQKGDEIGALVTVDLMTGERKPVSGKYYADPPKFPVAGTPMQTVSIGTGPDLGDVRAVVKGPQGWLAFTPKGMIRVDPKTGDRTLEPTPACAGTTVKPDFMTDAIAAAPDGTVYVSSGGRMGHGLPAGVLAFKDGGCSVVTMGGKGVAKKGHGAGGNGPYETLSYGNGKLWARDGGMLDDTLLSIDIASGERVRIGSSVGLGETRNGAEAIAIDGAVAWSVGFPHLMLSGSAPFYLVKTSLVTGDRTSVHEKSGPAVDFDAHQVFVHPSRKALVLVSHGAVILFDPKTGDSNVLSR